MNRTKDIQDLDRRSAIWSVENEGIRAYFALYVLLYVMGSVTIVWLHVQRAGPLHEIVSDIITSMSLLGVGIAPTAAIVLTEIWGYAVILSRNLRLEVEKKENELRRRREETLREGRKEGRQEGHQEGYKKGYEQGIRDALAKMRESNSDDPPERTDVD